MFENEPMQSPQPPAPPSPAAGVPPQEVHTMPERFLDAAMSSPSGAPAGGSGKRTMMIIIIVVVVVAALGAGAWFYFTKLAKKTNQNANIPVVNTNVNRNLNKNVNANANVNTNANVNANANTNLNTNANSNGNANANVNTNANVNASTTTGTPISTSADADKDGLTDVEEAVYGTKTNAEDSDGDGFIDGMRTLANGKIEGEAYNGYCPTKAGSVRLDSTECNAMRTYTNATFNYAMMIPKSWVSQATSTDDRTVVITPDLATTEFFQIRVIENPTQLSAKSYYLNLNPGVDTAKLQDAAVNGLDGVVSLDASTVYFSKGTKIYEISYNSGNLTQVNLRTTFTIMYRSFRLVTPSTTNANSNVNGNANANANKNANGNANTNTPPVFQ